MGAWHYSGRYADLSDLDVDGDPLLRRGSSGAYVVGERLLMGVADGAGQRLSAFTQAGTADARTNRFGSYLGAGIVGSGWGAMRDADQAGLSAAHAHNGNHALRALAATSPRRAETTIDLSYLTRGSKYMTFQPDMQYVIHPDTNRSLANALVLQLRFELVF